MSTKRSFFINGFSISALACFIVFTFIIVSLSAYPASARNDCVCGVCTAVIGSGPSECTNPGGQCTIPSCGSSENCELSCGINTPCEIQPGFCSVNSYQMWSYGPLNRCYSFSSASAGTMLCNITIDTSCFGLNEGQQTNEKVRVVVNGATVGLTEDSLCNAQAPPVCFENGPLRKTFTNVQVQVNSGGANSVRLETVQDSISVSGFRMQCSGQTTPQPPVCGNNIVESPEQCEQNSQCNDNNTQTVDTCNNCQCRHESAGQFCGDGAINNNEQCEPPTSNNNAACSQSTQTCQGARTGIRDSYGYCSLGCGCTQDEFAYACIQGSCGAACDSNSDCNDGDPGTRDTCNNNCACSYEEVPYCGNGRLDISEQCESSADCTPGKVCSGCMCTVAPYCGDANTDAGEQCDYGSSVNGIPCATSNNNTCTYCGSDCSLVTLSGGGCGNYNIEYGEQCDEGTNNGAACAPSSCNDFCVYCTNTCQIGHVVADTCEYSEIPLLQEAMYLGYYEQGYASYGSAGICGDGLISPDEECDNGYENGIACTASCNGDCSYCTSDCEEVVVEGSPCVRKARPWDPIVVPACREIVYPVSFAKLDESCLGRGKEVTREVNASDNMKAKQEACALEPSNIYMNWENVQYSSGLKNITLKLEHSEENADIRIEYYDGSAWITQCKILRSQRDYVDSCTLKHPDPSLPIKLKAVVVRGGASASTSIDHTYLVAKYCSGPTSCGNHVVDLGETCDDGNLITGDGCDEFCGRENMLCAEWGSCIEGKQSQVCYYGNLIRTNTRNCGSLFFAESALSIWLFFLVIMLVLLLLFFPAIYLGLGKNKKR